MFSIDATWTGPNGTPLAVVSFTTADGVSRQLVAKYVAAQGPTPSIVSPNVLPVGVATKNPAYSVASKGLDTSLKTPTNYLIVIASAGSSGNSIVAVDPATGQNFGPGVFLIRPKTNTSLTPASQAAISAMLADIAWGTTQLAARSSTLSQVSTPSPSGSPSLANGALPGQASANALTVPVAVGMSTRTKVVIGAVAAAVGFLFLTGK